MVTCSGLLRFSQEPMATQPWEWQILVGHQLWARDSLGLEVIKFIGTNGRSSSPGPCSHMTIAFVSARWRVHALSGLKKSSCRTHPTAWKLLKLSLAFANLTEKSKLNRKVGELEENPPAASKCWSLRSKAHNEVSPFYLPRLTASTL